MASLPGKKAPLSIPDLIGMGDELAPVLNRPCLLQASQQQQQPQQQAQQQQLQAARAMHQAAASQVLTNITHKHHIPLPLLPFVMRPSYSSTRRRQWSGYMKQRLMASGTSLPPDTLAGMSYLINT